MEDMDRSLTNRPYLLCIFGAATQDHNTQLLHCAIYPEICYQSAAESPGTSPMHTHFSPSHERAQRRSVFAGSVVRSSRPVRRRGPAVSGAARMSETRHERRRPSPPPRRLMAVTAASRRRADQNRAAPTASRDRNSTALTAAKSPDTRPQPKKNGREMGLESRKEAIHAPGRSTFSEFLLAEVRLDHVAINVLSLGGPFYRLSVSSTTQCDKTPPIRRSVPDYRRRFNRFLGTGLSRIQLFCAPHDAVHILIGDRPQHTIVIRVYRNR